MPNKVWLGGRGVKFSPSRKQRKFLNNTKTKKNNTIRKTKNKGFEKQRKVYNIGKHRENMIIDDI